MATQMIDVRQLGWRLELLRMWRGRERDGDDYSLDDIFEALGIPPSTLSRWERGLMKRGPEPRALARLADFYGVDLNDLLDPDYDTRVWLNPAA